MDVLNALQVAANRQHANTDRYIRPIMLVQVERTGKDQREAGFIHADDARQFLLTAGLMEREIAIKTSEVNDLKAPENQELESPTNCVRVIITKQALQEGWDCPFAYVLCSLSASQNMNAMTQLIGRILRQPEARKTGDGLLDECYVLCHHAQTREVVAGIKKGLEDDGMADLAQAIKDSSSSDNGGRTKKRTVPRRRQFERVEIFLPVVNWVESGNVRPLDYEQDVLLSLDWSAVQIEELVRQIPADDSHLIVSQMMRISVTDGTGGNFSLRLRRGP